MAGYYPPSIKKSFQVLGAIGQNKSGLSLSEISRTLGMSKATVHGILGALKELGVLVQEPSTRRFLLGPTLIELGTISLSQISSRELVRPLLVELMEETKGTVYLGILNDTHVTILDVVESTTDMKITSSRGSTVPLFAAALGKVMLGFLEEEVQREILKGGLPKFTENSITDRDLFLAEVKKAKELGYGVDMEEYISGIWAVAAPIENWFGIPAALWVVGFKTSLEAMGIEKIASATKRTAEKIRALIQERV